MMHRGFFLFSFMVKAFWGTSDGIAGDGGTKGLRFFLPFYFFTFLPLNSLFTFLPFYLLKAAAACYTEGGSDGCKEGDCNLQNCFPGTCFHNL
jgi:hypothetical protein